MQHEGGHLVRVTGRPSGLCARIAERAFSALRPVGSQTVRTAVENMSVSVQPGQTAFTVTPRSAHSTASARVRPTRACLLAQ